MEERMARVESHIEHIQSDLTEVKARVGRVSDDLAALALHMERSFALHADRMNAGFEKVNVSFEKVNASIAALALSTERSFSRLTRWGLLLYVGLAGTLLGIMAHGFRWL